MCNRFFVFIDFFPNNVGVTKDSLNICDISIVIPESGISSHFPMVDNEVVCNARYDIAWVKNINDAVLVSINGKFRIMSNAVSLAARIHLSRVSPCLSLTISSKTVCQVRARASGLQAESQTWANLRFSIGCW